MIVERSMNDGFLSNTYLVADHEGGSAALVDAGGPVAPLLARADELGVSVTHVLLTHHHGDHVAELDQVLARWPDATVVAHPLEAEQLEGVGETLEGGGAVRVGELEVSALHTPGHTAGMLALVVDGEVFTGDTLFKGSVGGVKAPGSTSYADLKASIMDVLMALPKETVVRPGHTEPTTIGEEWEGNAFVRVWRGLDSEGDDPCQVWGRDARLVLWAPDYDGGHKAWIRWADTGDDDIVPGSQVERH